MSDHDVKAPHRLHRDRFTLNIYTYFISWGWMIYAFSPAVPLLGDEQGVSRAVAGLHGTAMACGTIAAGLLSGRLVRRFGRKAILILGAAILITGVAILIFGPGLPFTLTGAFLSSLGGPLSIAVSQSALSIHHKETGSAAISEANGIAAGFGLIAPLAVGAAVAIGWGWRPAVALTAIFALTAALWTWRAAPAPALSGRATATRSEPNQPRVRSKYTRTFWAFLTAVVFSAALENAVVYWASDFIRNQTGAGEAMSTAGVSGLVGGMFVCRMAVGPISLRKAPEKLMLVAFAVSTAGWLVFWLATTPPIAVAGLIIMGLGVGAMYPMAVVLVIRASAGRPDQALGLTALAVGLAIGVSPFALGALADAFGPKTAFLIVPMLAVGGVISVWIGHRSVRQQLRDQIAETAVPK